MLRQKYRRRVVDALQPFFGHRKHAKLVDRAEAILDCADQAEARMAVAFEIKHGIDAMFEHAWPSKRAILGHVTDKDHRHASALGDARQLCRAFAHLRNRARRRSKLL